MRTVNKKAREARKVEIMEKCFACYCDNGLNGVGIKAIAKACDINSATLYQYFDNLKYLHLNGYLHNLNAILQK